VANNDADASVIREGARCVAASLILSQATDTTDELLQQAHNPNRFDNRLRSGRPRLHGEMSPGSCPIHHGNVLRLLPKLLESHRGTPWNDVKAVKKMMPKKKAKKAKKKSRR
jgi:hypothetical protein